MIFQNGFIKKFMDRYPNNPIKKLLDRHPRIIKIALHLHNNLNIHNKIRVKNNTFICGSSYLSNVKFTITGENNTIEIGDNCRLYNWAVTIRGNNNKVKIGEYCYLNEVGVYFEDDKNSFEVGNSTALCGRAHFAAMEGTKIVIGNNCLFSGDLHFRTGDSHSIVDKKGKRINKSKDIYIGDHVWVETKVTCLKNVKIPSDCVIAATSTVCGKFTESGCVIGGVPAKVIKKDINWDQRRL